MRSWKIILTEQNGMWYYQVLIPAGKDEAVARMIASSSGSTHDRLLMLDYLGYLLKSVTADA